MFRGPGLNFIYINTNDVDCFYFIFKVIVYVQTLAARVGISLTQMLCVASFPKGWPSLSIFRARCESSRVRVKWGLLNHYCYVRSMEAEV